MFVCLWEPLLCLSCLRVLGPLFVPPIGVVVFDVILLVDYGIKESLYCSIVKRCAPLCEGVSCFIAWIAYMGFYPLKVDIVVGA